MERATDFTSGKILSPLLKFMIPILLAMLLQDLYGAVDLLIVGRFAQTADVSGVTTGAQIMSVVMNLAINFSMGITILLGQQIGRREREKGGEVIGAGIALFFVVGIVLSVLMIFFSRGIAGIMRAPEEAFDKTVQYITICGGGSIIVIAFNLIGSIFRGVGDSRTPLIAVGIACVINIFGDLLLVAVFGMGAAGAAIATVGAQAGSVLLSLKIISKRELPFTMKRRDIRFNGKIIRTIITFGLPLAVQGVLVSLSFLVILAIVNNIGVVESAGMGIANKIIAFIMLTPASFGQAMAAFVAQNAGARQYDRAMKALKYGIMASFACGIVMSILSFSFGENLALLFTVDHLAAVAAHSYLKAYAIDCLLTAFLFCFIGFFNGIGFTRFVMAQGIIGAFGVRVPASYLLSKWKPVSLFKIGLATPMSTFLQIVLCFICLHYARKHYFPDSAISDDGEEEIS